MGNNSCPCKGCQNRTIYCHAECISYTEWRDALDEYNQRQRPNEDAVGYTVEMIRKKRRQANVLKRRTRYDQ